MAETHSTRRSASSPRPRRTEGQCRYDGVAVLEQKLHSMMDEIPYEALGSKPKTCAALDRVARHLQDVVSDLQIALDEEIPRCNEASHSALLVRAEEHAGTAADSSTSTSSNASIGSFTDDDGERTPLPDLPAALPCPFCGRSEDIQISKTSEETSKYGSWFRANCGTCGVDAPGGFTLLEAAVEWNKRPETPATTAGNPLPDELPWPLHAVIDIQQTQVRRLCSLLKCMARASEHGAGFDDFEGCLYGLFDYADSIERALDPAALMGAARKFKEDQEATFPEVKS